MAEAFALGYQSRAEDVAMDEAFDEAAMLDIEMDDASAPQVLLNKSPLNCLRDLYTLHAHTT